MISARMPARPIKNSVERERPHLCGIPSAIPTIILQLSPNKQREGRRKVIRFSFSVAVLPIQRNKLQASISLALSLAPPVSPLFLSISLSHTPASRGRSLRLKERTTDSGRRNKIKKHWESTLYRAKRITLYTTSYFEVLTLINSWYINRGISLKY